MKMETEELLRAYSQSNSESAFRELVGRYVDMVYSVVRMETEKGVNP